METPISAREFIRRFHLPQLVRITLDDGQPEPQTPSDQLAHTEPAVQGGLREGANLAGGNQVRVSIGNPSNCLPASRRHEQRDLGWIYAPGGGGGPSADQSGARVGALHEADEDENEIENNCGEPSGSRSLHLPEGCASLASGAMSLRLLPRVKLQARKPALAPTGRHRPALATSDLLNGGALQHDRTPARPPVLQRTQPKGRLRPAQAERDMQQQQQQPPPPGIKLMPPCKRPTLGKLHLEQPFLLCKAYRKLEVCAYAIDSNNQLNDKSGDPLYFPHNYQGKLERCLRLWKGGCCVGLARLGSAWSQWTGMNEMPGRDVALLEAGVYETFKLTSTTGPWGKWRERAKEKGAGR